MFQPTIKPWILVPDARKALIWYSDFHFWGGSPDPPLQDSCLWRSHGEAMHPLSKISGSAPVDTVMS